MDSRAAKLALARQKLKSHQEKKLVCGHKEETIKDQFPVKTDEHQTEFVSSHTKNQESDNIPVMENTNEKCNKTENNSQETNLNVTEILISNKRSLEMQVDELRSKLTQLENNYTLAINNNNYCKQQICNLQNDYQILKEKFILATEKINTKDKTIEELMNLKSSICDENNNLQEQLEFTKNMLNTKEAENMSLQKSLNELENKLDATQLQLQQLTNGLEDPLPHADKQAEEFEQYTQSLLQKTANLELQLKTLQKERDQISSHYEHYVADLNEQLKYAVTRNNDLLVEVQKLSARESSLVEHISDMEIRLQQMKRNKITIETDSSLKEDKVDNEINNEMKELLENNEKLQAQLQELQLKYKDLLSKYAESEAKANELVERKESERDHDNLSLLKLSADIASDKLAAQRATEQNKKLKTDLQELEEAFVKISRDKLELTEKVTAEKYLNRELTIKLAEVEEKATDMFNKLLAKDEEMIRLQNSYRDLERKLECVTQNEHNLFDDNNTSKIENLEDHEQCSQNNHVDHVINFNEHHNCNKKEHSLLEDNDSEKNMKIPRGDAMVRLQERFLKIMAEVADLSDEKHRLEHIILQLQNETDTICEYVALYQQQRSLLKKRDEERSAQIKIFQAECDQLKMQLEELSGIIIRLAQDTELAAHFQTEPRQTDLAKVMNLLSNLKSNTLIDSYKANSELKNFYPCSCCSGQLIDV